MGPVELVGLGGEPINVAADRMAVGCSQLELDEVSTRQTIERRQHGQLPGTVSRKIDVLEAPLVCHAAVQVAYADDRPQSLLTGERVIDQHDRARVVGVLDVHRLIGDLGAEVGAGRIQEIVVQMPMQRRPGVVEHPVDDAGRGLVGIHVRIERLELRADVVIVVELRLGDVVLKALGWAVAPRQCGVERLEGREYRPGGRGVILPRLRVLPQCLELLRREHAGKVVHQAEWRRLR